MGLSSRTFRLMLCGLALVVAARAPASAATGGSSTRGPGNSIPGSLIGFGIGGLLPEGDFAEFNDPSYFVQSRSLYVEKIVGGRAALYYGDTAGTNGQGGGHVFGFDFDFLMKFGSPKTFGYVYVGAGYGSLSYSAPGTVPGSSVRHSGYDWCWTGGIGVTINRKLYIEASYVSYQTSPSTTDFIPVVIGFQF